MISRSGKYWSTGITVRWSSHTGSTPTGPTSGWYATVEYFDDGFCNDDTDAGNISTQGAISTRYGVSDGSERSGLSAAVDTLIADAARLGIEFRPPFGETPSLCMVGDGEHDDVDYPAGWRALINSEADRIGWHSPYRDATTTPTNQEH